jgi:hypothetical protein
MIQSPVSAADSLLMTGRAGWLGLRVKPPPFTGRRDGHALQGTAFHVSYNLFSVYLLMERR